MKIHEFVEGTRKSIPPEMAEILIKEHSIWTNDACYGYVIMAMEATGSSREQIIEITHHLKELFDIVAPEEAEKHWANW